MNPYALPALVAIAPFIILGAATLTLDARSETNRLLSAVCLLYAVLAGTVAGLHLSETAATAAAWNPWPLAVVLVWLWVLFEYALSVAGGEARRGGRLGGVSVARHRQATAVVLLGCGGLLAAGLVTGPPVRHPVTGWEHGYGPAYPVFVIGATYVIVALLGVLWRGVQAARQPRLRRSRRRVLVALAVGLVLGNLLGFVLPSALGWPTHAFSMLPFVVVAYLLLYNQLRDQFETIQGLAHGLEEKVTERTAQLEATQARLVHAETMASLGQVTAGIAHEIMNPLNFVTNFARLARELLADIEDEPDPGERAALRADLDRNLERIDVHGRKAEAIVRSMQEHARVTPAERRPLALNPFVAEHAARAWERKRARTPSAPTAVETDLDTDVGEVPVADGPLGQVVANLVANAFDAVVERAATGEPGYRPRVAVHTRRLADGVEIRVVDNGPGVPDGLRTKVFEPFYTTRAPGRGTGLGLSLSHEVVTHGHGGALWVEAAPGGGAAFVMTLPGTPPALA